MDKLKALLLFLTVLVLSFSFTLCHQDFDVDNRPDPEQRLQQCRQQCQQQQRGQQLRLQCERRCEEQYQQERREQGRDAAVGSRDPARRQYEECKQQCVRQRHDEQQRRQCESRCEAQYEEERREHRRHGNPGRKREQEQEQEREQQSRKQSEGADNNPYLFDRESFYEQVRSEHGRVRILQNFLEKSKLLLGIANYRVAIAEAKPHAFFAPHHLDADVLYFAAQGCGAITTIRHDKKETHNLQRGDILYVPAGSIVYFVNKDSNDKLVLIKLINPVSTPGRFEANCYSSFFAPRSSNNVLSMLQTRSDRLQKLFRNQKKIMQASEEQIRELSRQSSEGHQWPFGGSESEGTFNILRKRPSHSSRRGQMHEADGHDYSPLKQLDIRVSYANLSSGSMIAPFFNTRSIKIAVPVKGEAYFEMVCPHLSEQRESGGEQQEEEQGRRQSYQKIRSEMSTGKVLVIPPGHPAVTVASGSENFEAVCFEINAERNERNFLAGKNNVFNNMDRAAKELAFGMPAREVDEVFQEQKEQVIVAGPEERDHGRRRPVLPMLDFAAAFM
ncbi:cupincin-like [Canna indica]|uniref:Cupincin-like n=1 Tax=Canna indica TaxID=4628 RepID=A0AAQ3JKI3_9LILI|nr:cupincin-like [Canna indica]